MKKALTIIAALAVFSVASRAMAGYYVAGDFQGWDPGATVMTETSPGSGIWQVSLTGISAGRHEFKITDGTWGWNYPGANSWLYEDASGNVTISFSTNTVNDGWSANVNRIGISASGNPGSWNAVGNFLSQVGGSDWDNASAAGVMTSIGSGVYELDVTLAPGTYDWKAVQNGTWDSISWDNRSINTGNMQFTTTLADPTAKLFVDTLNGVVKVDLIPEPSTIMLVCAGLAGLLAFGRKH